MQPGEVWHFFSEDANYPKYHLCVSRDGHFLYLNTPRKTFPGDFIIQNSDVAFLPPTESGTSVISCNLVVSKTPAELKNLAAKLVGKIDPDLLRKLMLFIEETDAISEEHRELAMAGLGDWC